MNSYYSSKILPGKIPVDNGHCAGWLSRGEARLGRVVKDARILGLQRNDLLFDFGDRWMTIMDRQFNSRGVRLACIKQDYAALFAFKRFRVGEIRGRFQPRHVAIGFGLCVLPQTETREAARIECDRQASLAVCIFQ